MPPALFELTAATALYAPPALRWSGAPWCVVLSYGHLALNRRLRPGRPAPARPSATLAACLAVILRRPPPRQVLLLNRPGTDLLRHAAHAAGLRSSCSWLSSLRRALFRMSTARGWNYQACLLIASWRKWVSSIETTSAPSRMN